MNTSPTSTILVLLCLLISSCGISCVNSHRGIITERVCIDNSLQLVSLDVSEGSELVVSTLIDLGGGTVQIPANVLITFKRGGAIVNGVLSGNGTRIQSKYNEILGVELKGTWNVDQISDRAFSRKFLSDNSIINNLNVIQSDSVYNEVIIQQDIEVTIPWSGGAGLQMSSNSRLLLEASLKVTPNSYKAYNIVQVKQKKNVTICGGKIIGDVGYHSYVDGSSSEWGMGIDIEESESVVLRDLYITKCTGDGVYISGGYEASVGIYEHASKNVTLNNVVCDDNRRQGLSIIHIDGLIVRDCSFINTGRTESTAPSAGIDIEPNVTNGRNMSVRNVVIDNCIIKNNRGMAVANSTTRIAYGRVNHENILYSNCSTDGLLKCSADDVTFRNCSFKEARLAGVYTPTHIYFENCSFAGGYGIVFHTPSTKGVLSKDRLLSVSFKGCSISTSVEDTETKSLLNCNKSHIQNLASICFENCRFEIPLLKDSSFSFTNNSFMGKLRIKSSEIIMTGRLFNAEGLSLDSNTIHCRKVLKMPDKTRDRVLIEE